MAVENSLARIGKTVVICGEVKGSEDLIIDGRVEGTVTLAENRLTVVATARVELRAGCSVEGDIRAIRLAVEDNAVFRGTVDLTQGVAKGHEVTTAPATGGAV